MNDRMKRALGAKPMQVGERITSYLEITTTMNAGGTSGALIVEVEHNEADEPVVGFVKNAPVLMHLGVTRLLGLKQAFPGLDGERDVVWVAEDSIIAISVISGSDLEMMAMENEERLDMRRANLDNLYARAQSKREAAGGAE